MSTQASPLDRGASLALRMAQPQVMKTKAYISGVETLDGDDAWALFEACGRGDVPQVKALLAKDRRLVNAQYWYRFPIHVAVFAGQTDIVRLLLDHGADPGESIYTFDSWNKLLRNASERGYRDIESLLEQAMRRRFNYSPDFNALKEAILARERRKIGAILRRRPNLIDASDSLGNNSLHWGVLSRQLDLIKRFVELGTPIEARRADGQTPLLLAVNGATDYWYRATRGSSHPSLRNTDVLVGSLLALGAKYTISAAAAVGDLERVEELVGKDSSLAKRLDSCRVSPLSYAARAGHLHIVRRLLELGADPNAPEDAAPRGRALFEACSANHLPIAELLLERGADPNAGTDSNGCCLTIVEVCHGKNAKPLQQLLRRYGAQTPPYAMSTQDMKRALREGAQVTRHEEFFDCVMAKGNAELLELYLDAEPAPVTSLQSGNGMLCPKSPALARQLLTRGLNPNQANWLGKTLLHACAEEGNRAVSAALLDAGADLNARDVEFQGTPLAGAVRAYCGSTKASDEPHHRMVKFLLERGAATNTPGEEPWATPLSWATRLGCGDVVALLKRYGAS